MTKRFLSVILAAVLLFGALPIAASAADTDVSAVGVTMIKSLSATIAIPVIGQKPSYTASVPSGKGYRVKNQTSGAKKNGVEWYNDTKSEYLQPDAAYIEAGNDYSVTIILEPVSDAYAFDYDNATATLNGQEAEIVKFINGEGEIVTLGIRYSYSFPDPNLQYISSIAATIMEPSAGAKPSYSASVPSGKGYRIKEHNESGYLHGVRWASAKTFQSMDPYSDVFTEGDEYLLELYFEPVSSSYAFDVDNISGTINGKEAAVIKYMAGDKVVGIGLRERYFCYGDSGTPITVARCTVTAPAFSKKPSYSAAIPLSADYSVYTITDGYFTNGVRWYNVTDQENMIPTSQFQSEKVYTVTILLTPHNGYYFAGIVSGTVNSNSAKCYRNSEGILEVQYTFTCTSGLSMGSIIRGSYTSFSLDDNEYPVIELLQGSTVKYTKLCGSISGSYAFTNIGFGTYTLRVSKKNHVTREYTVSCQGNISDSHTVDVKIHPRGDIDGDGKVNAKDYGMASAHAQKVQMLTGYALLCGDVVKNDGKIKAPDAARISAHVQKVEFLW